MLNPILAFLGKAVAPFIDGLKWFGTIFLARKTGQQKEENKNLEKTNEVQKQQLETASRPPSTWSSILERMRIGKR